jgi:hypothetical protein
MNEETRKTLELFVTKANELQRRDFLRYFEAKGKVGLSYHVNDDGSSELEIIGPDEDAVLAFMTTFRLFIQEGEPISIRSISKVFEKDNDISQNFKDRFSEAREHLNSYLDECPIQTEPPSKKPTRREILDIFINGDIFHVKDAEKRSTYLKWAKSPIQFTLYNNEFDLAVDYVAQIIIHIASLAKAELEMNVLKG